MFQQIKVCSITTSLNHLFLTDSESQLSSSGCVFEVVQRKLTRFAHPSLTNSIKSKSLKGDSENLP